MTGHGDFPLELQHLVDKLIEEGFSITYGVVEGDDGGGIGFVAEEEETVIQVTDRTQTWFLTMRDPERPDVDDCWDYPSRILGEVLEWLQDYPED